MRRAEAVAGRGAMDGPVKVRLSELTTEKSWLTSAMRAQLLSWQATPSACAPQKGIVSRRRSAILVFSALAALSVATTCQWASATFVEASSQLCLKQWLRDTTLFKQAWVSLLEKPPGHCRSLASAQSGALCSQRRVGQLGFQPDWMLTWLGFRPREGGYPIFGCLCFLAKLSTSRLIAIPGNIGHPNFMYLPLTPHIVVFAPLLMNSTLAAPKAPISSQQPPFVVQAGEMVALLATAIRNVMSKGKDSEQIRTALYEHPAVRSVGWDAMCCWLSFSAWTILGQMSEKKSHTRVTSRVCIA
ncbi:hypothetical protein NM208_g5150 [Fusarium decemcellulare]|uniref:Uncharacterized protein n=1 Tax=Fusarium decemcellulare TaxID=57161 RepID=A0ACC1SI05_9HYPO|nr:hypothetical protein NM208_g5150 [Fusarium decemcellulare]